MSAGEWCKAHWIRIVTTIAVLAVAVIAVVVFGVGALVVAGIAAAITLALCLADIICAVVTGGKGLADVFRENGWNALAEIFQGFSIGCDIVSIVIPAGIAIKMIAKVGIKAFVKNSIKATKQTFRNIFKKLHKGGKGVLENANYAQKTYSNTFSADGRKIYSKLAGESINTIDDLVNAINAGKINVADLPVEYIVRDGNTLILNTRTSQALTQAGIPRSQWNAVNRTGNELFEELLNGQLSRNKLPVEGISTVKPSGGK